MTAPQQKKSTTEPDQLRRKVLLVTDRREAVCHLVSRTLEDQNYRVTIWNDPTEVLPMLRSHHFDALLIGVDPDDSASLELVGKLRVEFDRLPILVLTAGESSEGAAAALEAGASDVVSHGASPPVLQLRLQRTLDYERISRLADTDDLTHLHNRRVFDERLLQEIERAERYQHDLSLLLADIDFFKRFNDEYGHLKGDEVLVRVARIFRAMTRTSDLVARYGGEEFAVILPETTARQARHFAERIRVHVASSNFVTGAGRLTLSAGIATWQSGMGPAALVEAADRALYAAKRKGRNRIVIS